MKAQRVDVADQLFHYLTFRDWDAAAALAKPEDSVWLLFGGVGKYSHELAWEAISDESVDLGSKNTLVVVPRAGGTGRVRSCGKCSADSRH